MLGWLIRAVQAALIGALVWLFCILVGGLLAITGVPLLAYFGEFLVKWANLLAVIAALWYFAFGFGVRWSWPPRRA